MRGLGLGWDVVLLVGVEGIGLHGPVGVELDHQIDGALPADMPGVLMVNPPWTLMAELKAILPELEKPLGQGGAGRFRLETPKP